MSRSDARSDSLRHRPARTIPASIAAILLLCLGVGMAWIAVLKLANHAWPVFLGQVSSWLQALTWGSTIAIAISVAIALLGLVLVIVALTPGQPNALVLVERAGDDSTTKTEYVMTRRSVAKLATAHADLVDGVDSAAATVSARQVNLTVRSPSEQAGEIEQSVSARVRDALTAAGLQPLPRVKTAVRTTRI